MNPGTDQHETPPAEGFDWFLFASVFSAFAILVLVIAFGGPH